MEVKQLRVGLDDVRSYHPNQTNPRFITMWTYPGDHMGFPSSKGCPASRETVPDTFHKGIPKGNPRTSQRLITVLLPTHLHEEVDVAFRGRDDLDIVLSV